ncbi:MAG: DNA/RNA helicase domain-containing protein [Vulcanimicrobiaceae bacterium]
MQLYVGSTDEFVGDVTGHRITDRLRAAFYNYYGYQPAFSELNSWDNSLAQMALALNAARLADNGIVVEMELPLSSARLDCLLFGRSDANDPTGMVVELKQWTQAREVEQDGCVASFVGGAERVLAHPSLQSYNYAQYLRDSVTSYSGEGAVALRSCSYLHNLEPKSAAILTSPRFASIVASSPLFAAHDVNELIGALRSAIGRGKGMAVMKTALSGKQKPSRKLLEHTAAMVGGEPRYTLLDEQIVAFETILAEYRRARRSKTEHSVVVVKGGPGTGKSVIALNLVGTLSKLGVDVRHATGSKAFTQTLWKVLGNRVKPQFRYFNQFGTTEEGTLDVLVCDEAHRIRESSATRFTPKSMRTDRSQIEELLLAAKTSVFFVDDHQAVRPNEIGSSHLIREAAVASGARYAEVDLRTQFRCAGSESYLDWLDQLLEIRRTGRIHLSEEDAFDFEIVDTPALLDEAIKERIALGQSARLTAGFCWKWSKPRTDGTLVDDVAIGEFRRPWNAQPDAARLAPGIPPAPLWAWTPEGAGQVGCIYTAQGFEFDYVGVIFGTDLVIRNGVWVGQQASSHDQSIKGKTPETFATCVKNAYRVLMTRGLKGCYVTFLDDQTRAFVMERMAG